MLKLAMDEGPRGGGAVVENWLKLFKKPEWGPEVGRALFSGLGKLNRFLTPQVVGAGIGAIGGGAAGAYFDPLDNPWLSGGIGATVGGVGGYGAGGVFTMRQRAQAALEEQKLMEQARKQRDEYLTQFPGNVSAGLLAAVGEPLPKGIDPTSIWLNEWDESLLEPAGEIRKKMQGSQSGNLPPGVERFVGPYRFSPEQLGDITDTELPVFPVKNKDELLDVKLVPGGGPGGMGLLQEERRIEDVVGNLHAKHRMLYGKTPDAPAFFPKAWKDKLFSYFGGEDVYRHNSPNGRQEALGLAYRRPQDVAYDPTGPVPKPSLPNFIPYMFVKPDKERTDYNPNPNPPSGADW